MARIIVWFAAFAWVTGCAPSRSGGSTPGGIIPAQPAQRQGLRSATLAQGVGHVFLADAALNLVTIFDRNGKTRQIAGFDEPQGLTTDRFGSLYVANTAAQNVEEFAKPYRTKPRTIATPKQFPIDVAVAKDGTVAFVNICQGYGSRCTGAGNVYFFANNRSQTPCAVVSGGSHISRLLWAAFDASGALYVAGVNNYTTAKIGRITGECSASALTVLTPSTSISFASGIQVDPSGNVAIINGSSPSGLPLLDVFAAPKSGSRQLKLLSQAPLLDSSVVSSFALTKDGTHFFTAEPHYSLEYGYPNAGYLQAQITPPPSGGDLIEGVAVTPAEVP